ncbi:MAG: tetratricopeptide repeat protein [Fibrobacterota bacterium]
MKSRTAEKTVEALMTRFNKNPQSLVFSRLADEYRKDGNYSKAIEICINGLQNHPDYVTGRIILGMCYTEQGNHQAAIQELLAAIVLDRRNQNAMKLLADLFNRQGNGQIAGDLYHMLSKSDPGNRSLQIISKQFTFSGDTDIFSILGLPSPQTSFNFKAKEQQYTANIDNTAIEQPSFHDAQTMALSEDGFDAQTGNDNSSQVTPEEVGSRMDEMFGLSGSASPVNQMSDQQIQQDFNSSDSLSGEDIADRMNSLFTSEQPQDIIETVGAVSNNQSDFFDSDEQIMPPDASSIDLITENGDLSGNAVSDHIESLFGDDSLQQPDHTALSSSDTLANNDSDMLTGNDLQNHLELLMPSDNPQSNLIQDDFSNSIIETSLSNTNPYSGDASGISGNDFANHLDSLTIDDDKLLLNTDTSDDLQQDLLSMSDEEVAAPAHETLSGDDFASHMDSLLSSDDIQPDLQSENDFGNVINLDNNEQDLLSDDSQSGLEGSDNSFMHDMTPELQSPGELHHNDLILDTMITDDTSIPVSSETSPDQSENSSFGVESVDSSENDTLTGADFANHMDMLLGDEEAPDQSIYNKISNSFDTDISIPTTDTGDEIVSGDDIGDRLDIMTGDLQSAMIEEPDETSQGGFGTTGSIDEMSLNDYNVSGDDIVDKIDIISGDFSSNQPNNNQDSMHQFTNQQDNLLETPDEQVSGSDVSDRIGALENEPFLNIDQVGPDGNTPDSSPFANTEFEETMQIDRSFIENVQSFRDNDIQEKEVTENVQVQPPFNPFEFENETIQIDRSELFAHPADSEQHDKESLILDVENPTPNHDSLFVTDDIHIDKDEHSISEMDVLVEPSKDIQNVTGEDVIDKLDNIFAEEVTDQENLSADELSLKDIFTSEVSLDNTIGDISDTASWPETQQQDSSPAQNNDNVTGNDVEQRLAELFSDDSSSDTVSKVDQSYQEAVEELEVADDYQSQGGFMMTELENSMEDNQAQGPFDNQEATDQFDSSGMQSAFSATVNDEQLPESDDNVQNEIDTRDKPYSIPDHVLTPTLADIYYQQGQYQLALQIYSRLIEKEPSNLNLQDRYDEIQKHLAAEANQPGRFYDFGSEQDGSTGKNKAAESDKPLSGVRIKKNKKPKK